MEERKSRWEREETQTWFKGFSAVPERLGDVVYESGVFSVDLFRIDPEEHVLLGCTAGTAGATGRARRTFEREVRVNELIRVRVKKRFLECCGEVPNNTSKMKDTPFLLFFLSSLVLVVAGKKEKKGAPGRTSDALCVLDLVSETEEPCEPGELAAFLLYVVGSLGVFGHLFSSGAGWFWFSFQ